MRMLDTKDLEPYDCEVVGFSRSEPDGPLLLNVAAGDDEARCRKANKAATAEKTTVRSILKIIVNRDIFTNPNSN